MSSKRITKGYVKKYLKKQENLRAARRIAAHSSSSSTSFFEPQNDKLIPIPLMPPVEANDIREETLQLEIDHAFDGCTLFFMRIVWLLDEEDWRKFLCPNYKKNNVQIFTNQVENAFCWDGAKKKEAFKKLRMPNGILEAMKKQFVDIFETKIIDIVKQWLVKAKERLGKERPEENK